MSYLVFECWLLVWVLLDTTTLNSCSAACTGSQREYGDIRIWAPIQGPYTYVSSKGDGIAGYMQICNGTEWKAVCESGWDIEDAMVVCRQLGFDPQGAGYCTENCFGRAQAHEAFTDVACNGNESRLIDCQIGDRNTENNCPNVGVLCANLTSQPIPLPTPTPSVRECPTTEDCPPDQPMSQATPLPTVTSCECATIEDCPPGQEQREGPVSSKEIIWGLGALAAGLGLALVGVVMGWVCHCHGNQRKSNPKMTSDLQSQASPHSTALPPVLPLYETPDTITNSALQPRSSTEPGGGAMTPNPSYATTASISRPRPSPQEPRPSSEKEGEYYVIEKQHI